MFRFISRLLIVYRERCTVCIRIWFGSTVFDFPWYYWVLVLDFLTFLPVSIRFILIELRISWESEWNIWMAQRNDLWWLTDFSFDGMLIWYWESSSFGHWTSWMEFQLNCYWPLQHSVAHPTNYGYVYDRDKQLCFDRFQTVLPIVHCSLSTVHCFVGHFRFNVWNVLKCFSIHFSRIPFRRNTIPHALLHNSQQCEAFHLRQNGSWRVYLWLKTFEFCFCCLFRFRDNE